MAQRKKLDNTKDAEKLAAQLALIKRRTKETNTELKTLEWAFGAVILKLVRQDPDFEARLLSLLKEVQTGKVARGG